MARQLDQLGIEALVMFNRMLQADFNLQTMEVEPFWPVRHYGENGVSLRWVSGLFGQLNASIAATTGTQDHEDIIKYLLAGADIVMLASALIKNGACYLETLLKGLERWMSRKGFESLKDMQGAMSHANVQSAELLDRANYIRMLDSKYKLKRIM